MTTKDKAVFGGKRTKIVATIGPACDSKEMLAKMIKSGMNVARINFSHGTHESNGKVMRAVRTIREELDMPVGIIADLQGPRIRTLVEDEVMIKNGEIILITDVSVKKNISKSGKVVKLDWPGIIKDIDKGNEILIEDGLLKVRVVKKSKDYLEAEVIYGGIVKNHKGVNIPDADLKVGVITEKDESDLRFALSEEVEFIALSFVSNAKEIEGVRKKIEKILDRSSNLPQIISKIERKEAINNIEEIIHASDGIMVARGDLGIEMEESKVVIFQKEIIAKCLNIGKPVIVATQMLNSMIENASPTRAEVSDVSNAVIDHADAVMLSGETANGKYPLETINIMRKIIEHTEASPFDDLKHGYLSDNKSSVSVAVANCAHELAKDSKAKAIVVASISGHAARMIARHRPSQKFYVMTNTEKTHNQLALLWGVESFILSDCQTLDNLIDKSVRTLVKKKLIIKGDRVVIVTGRPHMKQEHMSLIKVEEVK